MRLIGCSEILAGQQCIEEYISNHNQNPQVFVWSAPAERILDAKHVTSKGDSLLSG